MMSTGVVRCADRLILSGVLSAMLLLVLSPAGMVWAQNARARVRVEEENFRKEPNGSQLATVPGGTELAVVEQRGDWVQVELSGWIWAPSVSSTDREGFDLVVSAADGENLRIRPQGRIVARALRGLLLDQLERQGQWFHVRRRGWIWKPSLELTGTPRVAGAAGSAQGAGTDGDAPHEPASLITAPEALVVHTSPDGDTVAVFQPGAQAQVMGRTGDWLRVRVDGWVYGPAALDSAGDIPDTGDLSPAALRADPARYKGALVRWRVQFISLRRAEPARSDFEEGEPFLLARGPSGEPGFVYLAVPEELLPVAERLKPLDYVTVVGRVRTGRSTLLGSPVIDLTDIEVEAARP